MKIVLCGMGTRGDVGPLITLAAVLRDASHEVVLLGSPPFARAAAGHDLRWREIGWDMQKALAEMASLRPQEVNAYYARHRYEQAGAEIEALLEEARDADVIVGTGAPLGAQSAAQYLKIPYRFLAFQPTYYRSAEWPDPLIPGPGGRLGNRISWMLADAAGGMVAKSVNVHRSRLGLPPLRNGFDASYDRGGRPILAAHPRLVLTPSDMHEHIVRYGAIRHPAGGPISETTRRYLDEGEPPLFIGFGSMPVTRAKSATAVAEAVRQTGRRAIFAGDAWDGIDLPTGSLRCGAEPHEALFRRVAAVVSHGGAGTVAAAFWAGVPQVVVAHGGDQPYWGRATVAAGVAPAHFKFSKVDAGKLRLALEGTLDERYTARVRQLAAEVTDSDGASDVAEEIVRPG